MVFVPANMNELDIRAVDNITGLKTLIRIHQDKNQQYGFKVFHFVLRRENDNFRCMSFITILSIFT